RLWDVDTGECVHTLQGHSSTVQSVVYSPKGDRIASGSSDSTVRLWDVDTGECVHTLQGHSDTVQSVVYSPKGDRIASGSDDKSVKLWKVGARQCQTIISGFSSGVSSIALESDFGARCLATGSFDKSVRRWRITKEGVEHKAVLCWSSSHEVLTVHDLSFEDAQGLRSQEVYADQVRNPDVETPNPFRLAPVSPDVASILSQLNILLNVGAVEFYGHLQASFNRGSKALLEM
ncbi:hypothetical protein BGZ80_001100, partial [Entomortierella chlamydospora]